MAITEAAKAHLAKLAERGARAKPEAKVVEPEVKAPAKKPAAKKPKGG